MKKLLSLFTVLTVAIVLASCTGTPATDSLVIFQNKVEIDDVLSTYATAWGEENGLNVEVQTCGGDSCAYGTQLLAEFQGNDQPDIFVIEGLGGFNQYKDKIYQFSGNEAWVDNTGLEFVFDGDVYGFPVAIEGWGMAYNKTILEAAGLTIPAIGAAVSQADFRAMFEAVEDYYTENSITDSAVVSMAAASGMTWVTGLHNFNGYLSAGLPYTDSTVIDQVNGGTLDDARFGEYTDWVELLFEFADQTILNTGGYDEQVGLFASGKAAFLHQGNWTDSSYANSDFEMGYLPHGVLATGNDSIFIGAPSYYVINKDGANIENAKAFLEDLAGTEAGHNYMVNEANMVPAFDSVTLVPSTPLSAAVLAWNQAGKAYAWWQNDLPAGFGMDTLGPIYSALASGQITRTEFISQVKAAVEALA
ncbi:MAG TPA: ABC transporter substrate-binding protein [Acholeplasmataceae bacterium]|nr:ABC transporter substrate-binding protein [Acholeplasmataceae bacterium]